MCSRCPSPAMQHTRVRSLLRRLRSTGRLRPHPGSTAWQRAIQRQHQPAGDAVCRRRPAPAKTSVFFVAGTPADAFGNIDQCYRLRRAHAGRACEPASRNLPGNSILPGRHPAWQRANYHTVRQPLPGFDWHRLTRSLAEDSTVTYTGQTTVPSGGALATSALVVQADDGSPGDLTRASVEYVVRNGLPIRSWQR